MSSSCCDQEASPVTPGGIANGAGSAAFRPPDRRSSLSTSWSCTDGAPAWQGISHRAYSHYPQLTLEEKPSDDSPVPQDRDHMDFIRQSRSPASADASLSLLVYASSRTGLDWTDVGVSRRSTTAGLGVSCGTAQLRAVRPVVSMHSHTSVSDETGAKSDSSREQQQQHLV